MRDLRANIASEAGARQTYEALIKACDDEGTKKALTHLLTREITHANMFMKALDSMDKLTDPMFGNIRAGRDRQTGVQSLDRARTCAVRGMKSRISTTSRSPNRRAACRRRR